MSRSRKSPPILIIPLMNVKGDTINSIALLPRDGLMKKTLHSKFVSGRGRLGWLNGFLSTRILTFILSYYSRKEKTANPDPTISAQSPKGNLLCIYTIASKQLLLSSASIAIVKSAQT